jgi:hypothetical protein
MEGQVRTPRETERARVTHFLSSADTETSQDTKRKLESEGHSLPVEPRQRDRSGRESERARNTHFLSDVEWGKCQTPKASKRGETH